MLLALVKRATELVRSGPALRTALLRSFRVNAGYF